MLKTIIHSVLITALMLTSLFAMPVIAGQTPEISQQTLLQTQEQEAKSLVILDVRSAEEFAMGHIKGAINISHDQIENNLPELMQYKDQKVVVYCRSGRRAGIAEHILAENGFNKLFHLKGDMNGWLAAELPVVAVEP